MAGDTSFVLHVKGDMKEGVVSRVVSPWKHVERAPISLPNPKAALIQLMS